MSHSWPGSVPTKQEAGGRLGRASGEWEEGSPPPLLDGLLALLGLGPGGSRAPLACRKVSLLLSSHVNQPPPGTR